MGAIIRAQNLGKQYQIGTKGPGYLTLREALMSAVRAPARAIRRNSSANQTIWALEDVSFEVNSGEVVGIIGRNGAGKSTLLRVLSRVTEPTTGRVELYGRVGALLEVGTGFHPELTGRENIFLNGSILGMARKEIERKFDAIVAFAEVEKFIDTPVKRYSSGMYVRLAFAVAAHLEPEILVVDEVLAVGDAAFQKKCLGRMRDVATEGRTVLFVSHNMAAVSALCTRAMVLNQGKIEFPLGSVSAAVQKYLAQINEITKERLASRTDRQGEGRIRITHFAVFDGEGEELGYLASGQEIEFRIYYEGVEGVDLKSITAAIGITSQAGSFVAILSNQMATEAFEKIETRGTISCVLKKLPLAPGFYTLNLIIRQNDVVQDWIQEAVTIVVEAGDFFGTGRTAPPSHGGVFLEQDWFAGPARDERPLIQ
jgi:lipopolysaccharide transport system ATP-binding protein